MTQVKEDINGFGAARMMLANNWMCSLVTSIPARPRCERYDDKERRKPVSWHILLSEPLRLATCTEPLR